MVCERIHIICGNCGEDKDLSLEIIPDYDKGYRDGHLEPEAIVICNNCGTLHSLSNKLELVKE